MVYIIRRQKERIKNLAEDLRRHRLGTLPKNCYIKGEDGKPHITRNQSLRNHK